MHSEQISACICSSRSYSTLMRGVLCTNRTFRTSPAKSRNVLTGKSIRSNGSQCCLLE